MVLIGAMLLTSINGLTTGMNVMITQQFGTFGANMLTISSGEENGFGPHSGGAAAEIPLNDRTVETLEGIRHVDSVVPFVQGAVILKKGRNERSVSVTGLDQSDFTSIVSTAELLEGRYVSSTDFQGILLSYNIAFDDEGEQQLKSGQTVSLEISVAEESGGKQSIEKVKKSFQVKGVLDETGNMLFDNGVYISLAAAKSLLNKGGEYDGIYVITEDSMFNKDIEEDIRDIYGDSIGITSPEAMAESINEVMGTFTAFLSGIAFISLIVGAVGIITTLYTSVIERTREVGLLKSIGFNNRMVLSSFMLESMLIGAIGGLTGVVTGIGGAYALTRVLSMGPGGAIAPAFQYIDLLYVWLISFGLSIFAGIYPAWRASKLSPLEALRKE
jgi:putative ABC transport system permease protein